MIWASNKFDLRFYAYLAFYRLLIATSIDYWVIRRLLIAIFIDYWVLRMLFVFKTANINYFVIVGHTEKKYLFKSIDI